MCYFKQKLNRKMSYIITCKKNILKLNNMFSSLKQNSISRSEQNNISNLLNKRVSVRLFKTFKRQDKKIMTI